MIKASQKVTNGHYQLVRSSDDDTECPLSEHLAFGIMFHYGAPECANAGAQLQPWRPLRTHCSHAIPFKFASEIAASLCLLKL